MRRAKVAPRADADTVDDYLPGHGDATYEVERYQLDLGYSPDRNRLEGRAEITATALVDLDRFALDLHGLRATKVAIPTTGVARFRSAGGKLLVRAGSTIAAGARFTVVVTYDGHPSTVSDKAGSAGWEELADGAIVAGQPGGAPSWFPCNDRPDNKATYQITVTAPSAYHVVANGRLAATRRSASATTWAYDQTEPMSTYLATLHIGRAVRTELADAPVPLAVVHPPSLRRRLDSAFGRMGEMVEAFERLFGPYPFDEYVVVVTEDELEIPLEAQGMAVFGSNFLTSDWSSVRLVAHELAHQWFGNSVTLRQWRDIWLHEGFACYAEWIWSEESGGRTADDWAREHWSRLADLDLDIAIGDPGPENMFDDRVYKRGALTLHALRLTMGDRAFFDLLRSWTDANRFANVTTPMFVEAASRAAGSDVGPLLNEWLYETELPKLPAAR